MITGGHLDPPNDLLSYVIDDVRQDEIFPGARIASRSTHGTGCAFATALACQLALGRELPEAVREAKAYVRAAIEAAYPFGKRDWADEPSIPAQAVDRSRKLSPGC